MLSYIWPIALVVISNVFYHICTKSVPQQVNPFAPLIVTYLVAAAASAVAFWLTGKGENIFAAVAKVNWASFVLGIVLLGLEAGFIFAYQAGWQVSTAAIVQSSFLAIALVIVGFSLFHEQLTWNKLVGVAICLVGLIFINMK